MTDDDKTRGGIDLFEEAIKKEYIKYYNFGQFNNVKEIGSGGFSKVYRAILNRKVLALKAFEYRNTDTKEIIREINLLRKVDYHENIIRFLGVTEACNEYGNSLSQNKKYMIVMEYADGGSLRNYLKNNFNHLTWKEKFKLAYQIAIALECIHNERIVHRDLNSNNVLVNQHKIKLADFGLSRVIEEKSGSRTAKLFGVLPYIDPNGFECKNNNKNLSQSFKLNEKCDIYSLGVLFWEISSGSPPFNDLDYDLYLAMKILHGLRETIVEGTPMEYVELYTACWDGEPNNRPTIQQIVNELKTIMSRVNVQVDEEYSHNINARYDGDKTLNEKNLFNIDFDIDNILTDDIETKIGIKAKASPPNFNSKKRNIDQCFISFAQFGPLIKEITEILNNLSDLYSAAQRNKKIVKLLLERVAAVNSAVSILRDDDLYTTNHYTGLQRLINVIQRMQQYSEDITQYNIFQNFLDDKTIETEFKKLCKAYNSSVDSLNLDLMVDFKKHAERESLILQEEIQDLVPFFGNPIKEVKNINKFVKPEVEIFKISDYDFDEDERREKFKDYVKLYTECWDGDPNGHKTFRQIVIELKEIMRHESVIIDDDQNYGHETNDKSLEISNNNESVGSSLSSQGTSKLDIMELEKITYSKGEEKSKTERKVIVKKMSPNFNDKRRNIDQCYVSFAQFIPLIKEVAKIYEKINDLYSAAQHNKKIVKLLLERVAAVNSAVSTLQGHNLYTTNHYTGLQRLINVIQEIKKYSEVITQYNTVQKYLENKTIETKFNKLYEECNGSVDSLKLDLIVDFKNRVEKESLILWKEIMGKNKTNGSRHSNCYIIYRLAFIKELKNYDCGIPMTKISPTVSHSWDRESRTVKEAYKRLSEEVRIRLENDRKNKLRYVFEYQNQVPNVPDPAPDLLNSLNAVKIVHRDISSENIVITEHDVAKITNNETISVNLNSNDLGSTYLNRKYNDILNLLKNADNAMDCNDYALREIIFLMEDLDDRPNEDNIEFACKAGKHLLDYQWNYYAGISTIVRLELFLRAMSSVIRIISNNVDMIDRNIRTSFYRSVSRLWTVYRNTKLINANIMFSLREIRTCLRKIKDDQARSDVLISRSVDFVNTFVSIMHKEYAGAFDYFVNALNFEYAAGKWYDEWKDTRKKYFELCRNYFENDPNFKDIQKFYKRLYKSSVKEWKIVQRKNSKFRNFEYKMLKSGGAITGCSLPDHIDTLLIGYLDLMQRLLEKFFLQLKRYIKRTVSFCNEMVDIHLKKQLTFKAVEVLYVIKENTNTEVEIKHDIESNFNKWIYFSSTSRPLSTPSRISNYTFSVDNIDKAPLNYPDSPTSAYTSFSTSPRSYLSQEENHQKQQRKLKFREIPKKVTAYLSNFKEVRQQRLFSTRKHIVENIRNLFAEQDRINTSVYSVKIEHDKLLADNTTDENSILSELIKVLKEKEEKIGSPNIKPSGMFLYVSHSKVLLDEEVNDNEKIEMSTSMDVDISYSEELEEKNVDKEAEKDNDLNVKLPEIVLDEEISDNEKIEVNTSEDVDVSYSEDLEEKNVDKEAEKDNDLNVKLPEIVLDEEKIEVSTGKDVDVENSSICSDTTHLTVNNIHVTSKH